MKGAFDSKDPAPQLVKELTIQVRKTIGPFASPRKVRKQHSSQSHGAR